MARRVQVSFRRLLRERGDSFLSLPLPGFEFDGMVCAGVRTARSIILFSPPECIIPACMRRLGGQDGGQS